MKFQAHVPVGSAREEEPLCTFGEAHTNANNIVGAGSPSPQIVLRMQINHAIHTSRTN